MANEFYNRYWGERGEGHLSDFDLKWPKLKRYIPLEERVTIADFGCGGGEILREISLINPSAKLIGLDVSDRALKRARQRLPQGNFHKIEDGGQFPLENRSADFVFSSEVIEHVYDTENAAAEITRILRPGGEVLMTMPYHGFLKNLLIVFLGFDRHFDPVGPHVRFFSKKTITGLLERAGLKVVHYDYYGRFFPFSHSMVVLAKKP